MNRTGGDSGYEAVIGLEVHVQLNTRTKLFCGCENGYGGPPNLRICPVCTGQPGTLPVLNQEALVTAIRAGLALGCTIAERTRFDRKNYFYPDLPKGYQISQFDLPLCTDGSVRIVADDGSSREIRIARAHMEEDAGKTIHPEGADHSLVDLNRACIPLLEIVSAPQLRSPKEAHRYLTQLRRTLLFARVSDCDMEKGSLRCDANISVRPEGDNRLYSRTEIKNLNSFRNVEKALGYEFDRQVTVVTGGDRVVQETRTFLEQDERTEPLRSKEEAFDYRYFPEPDLPDFEVASEQIEELRQTLPELPAARETRYVEQLGLPSDLAEILTTEPDHAEYFEACVEAGGDPLESAKYLTGTVLMLANEQGGSAAGTGIEPADLVAVIGMVGAGELSQQAARKVLPEIGKSGKSPDAVVAALGLRQISDRDELSRVVDEVIQGTPKAVEEYRGGKTAALNSLVGGVMKATKGKANPNLTRELLEEKLKS